MDGDRFDRLARGVAGLATRRGTVAGLLGGLALPLLGAAPTEAKNRRGKAIHAEKKRKKSCQPGLLTCKIKQGKKKKTLCVDAQTDPLNCGSCGTSCATGQTCRGGACVSSSSPPPPPGCTPDNAAACAGRECGIAVNTCGVTVNCGPRNGACAAGEACTALGQCVCAPDNAAACAGRACGTAVNNCGGLVNCGPLAGACPSGEACNANGQCICVPNNAAACAGRECGETINNCGETIACGGTCPSREKCDQPSGQCVDAFLSCPSTMCGVSSTCPTNCYCAQSVSGGAFCYVPDTIDYPLCTVSCASDADCNGGICTVGACCSGQPRCTPRINLTLCNP